jgi:pimeloyl-ACP methyl ester carboxylesterase
MNTVISKDGTSIAYTATGSGPALIHIYGATCFKDFMFIKQDVKRFSAAFTVYSYDRRGRGDSGDTLPWTVQKEVEDIAALIDSIGEPVMLYGHSSGAVLALEAAIALRDRITKVVIYDASYISTEAEKPAYQKLENSVAALLQAGKNGKAIRVFLKGIGMPGFFTLLMPLFPGWRTMCRLAPTLLYDIRLTKDVPQRQRLAAIRVPVLILAGAKSPAVILKVKDILAATITGSQARTIAGQDHMVSAKVLLPELTRYCK